MNVSPQEVLAVITLASSVTTSIFLGAYFLGKLKGRLERAEERIKDHDDTLDSHGIRIQQVEGDIRSIRGHRRGDD